MDYHEIFTKLWKDYRTNNPSVDRIHALLENNGEQVVNDHVAFRTFNLPGMDIGSLAKAFVNVGYKERGQYYFEKKKLNAKHYEHTEDEKAPKVFISELIVEDFSIFLQDTAKWIQQQVLNNKKEDADLIFLKRIWGDISYNSYKKLLSESEYAAWLYVYGIRANHFTIFVNYLKKINSLEEMNVFLKQKGFKLNTSGGEIKGSKADLLKQSSTLADRAVVGFIEGEYEIPCCYYEFAERFRDSNFKLFSGFIANSADKIFESTNNR